MSNVYLRKRDLSGNRESLYLQFYPPLRDPETMKLKYKEYLGIYVFKKPQDQIEVIHNRNMMETARAIQSKRILSIVNDEYGLFNKERLNEDFLEYFARICRRKNYKWIYTYKHFHRFVGGKCKFKDVTINLGNRFRDYLLYEAENGNKNQGSLGHNSAVGYFRTYTALMKMAHKERRIKENVAEHLEKVKWEDTHKEYLQLEEIKLLANTPCNIPALKSASIFSCLTGLRLSDILNLEWHHITQLPAGGHCMRIRTEKTKTEATLPLSEESLSWCGERSTGKVFKGFQRHYAYKPLKDWIKSAGIERNITFHSFRHTFASLQVSMGMNIYTVAKMMTHKHVSTTEIYAKIGDEKKVEAAHLITLK